MFQIGKTSLAFPAPLDYHIALKNIRQRLAIMCGGSLTITPGDGGGTVVTVTIPSSASPKMNP